MNTFEVFVLSIHEYSKKSTYGVYSVVMYILYAHKMYISKTEFAKTFFQIQDMSSVLHTFSLDFK